MTAVISAKGIRATIPAGAREGDPKRLLNGVDLQVNEGESIAILGRSGSGKSTLLSILGLMQPVDADELTISGIDVRSLTESRASIHRNELLGFVFQAYSLVPNLSVFENVALPLRYGAQVKEKAIERRVGEMLDAVGLQEFRNSRPSKLSGGEQQRVAIARALARQPSVILADEPTGALDVVTGQQVLEVLLKATRRAGSCLVVVTHDTEVSGVMDRSLSLRDGRLEDVPLPQARHRQ